MNIRVQMRFELRCTTDIEPLETFPTEAFLCAAGCIARSIGEQFHLDPAKEGIYLADAGRDYTMTVVPEETNEE